MQLISISFFLLVGVTYAAYRLFPARLRWTTLLISSLFFYLCAGIVSFIFILFFTLSSFFAALFIARYNGQGGEFVSGGGRREKKRGGALIIFFTVCILLAILMVVREASFVAGLGISFYSLRVISYLCDVKKGRIAPEKNFFKYALFVTFFPLAFLGPVVLYRDMKETLYSGKNACGEDVSRSLLRITVGVFKKVVIANALVLPLEVIVAQPDTYSGAYVLFLLLLYSAEIYCDFSGGIDICIGIAGLFSVSLPENFNKPFSSLSLREFWNRWHISLGEWFERYVFYPISLSRPMQKISRLCRKRFGTRIGKRLPLYAATLFTWTMTGLWHGSEGHFVAWGLVNGVLVLLSQEISRPLSRLCDRYPAWRDSLIRRVIARARVFLIIGAVRLLDVYKSLPLTVRMLSTAFYDLGSYRSLLSGGVLELVDPSSLALVLLSLLAIYLFDKKENRAEEISKKPFAAALCIMLLTLSTFLFGTYGLGFDASDFIYSKFNGG